MSSRLGMLVAGACAALACDRPAPGERPAPGPPAAAPASATAEAPASSPASPPPSAPLTAASGAPSAGDLPDFLVGRFSGAATVYASVVDGKQSYTKRSVQLTVDASGRASTKLERGPLVAQRFTPSYRCEASGNLRQVGDDIRLELTESTCAAAKAGSAVTFEVRRVGSCILEWKRKQGTPPFEVEQLAVRREGCQ